MRYALCLAACAALLASAPAAAFPILSYDTRMEVQPDSSVLVTETIVADFTGEPHHGIYRDIPFVVRDKYGNNYRIRWDRLGVTDENGRPLQTAKSGGASIMHLRIGDPNVLVSDVRTYVIRYRLMGAIRFFEEHDELYWNPVGAEWEVPIEKATCTVILPSDVPQHQLRTASYTGFYSSRSSDAAGDTPDSHTARFWMTRTLQPSEAMTIVVGWPKAVVREPALQQRTYWFISDNGYFFLPPIFLVLVLVFWTRVGRDPDTARSEVVAYDPPDGLGPAQLGTLIDERADVRDISAAIVDLAVRGFIHITAKAEKTFLSTKTDHLLELQKPFEEVQKDPDLTAFDKELIDALFGGTQFRWMSSLANQFYVHLPDLRDELYDTMLLRGYFTHSPDSVRTGYRVAGYVVMGIGVFSAFALAGSMVLPLGWGIAIALCGLMLAIAARTMPRKTEKGKNVLLAARGFEEYLSRAERENIEYQERQGYFEKFLPCAMAFGIADKWAKAFEGIQTKPPDWYSGDGAFSATLFAHDMSVASSGWASTMSSTPRSSGTGSGFGGGGGSGGGGGGGGGGGW